MTIYERRHGLSENVTQLGDGRGGGAPASARWGRARTAARIRSAPGGQQRACIARTIGLPRTCSSRRADVGGSHRHSVHRGAGPGPKRLFGIIVTHNMQQAALDFHTFFYLGEPSGATRRRRCSPHFRGPHRGACLGRSDERYGRIGTTRSGAWNTQALRMSRSSSRPPITAYCRRAAARRRCPLHQPHERTDHEHRFRGHPGVRRFRLRAVGDVVALRRRSAQIQA
jgi:hypothetical protein